MVPHSLIVCALLNFSLAAQAGTVPLDVNPAEVTAALDAVLHKDVGLQQGGVTGRDVAEAQVNKEDCKTADHCSDSTDNPPKIHTLHEWFAVPQNSSEANPLIAILLIFIATFFYLRRSPSTK
ncbi:hypothetical protein [Cellvibrio mixtus]|uniref:hypothetical protein n=1 Tax=Cellvibrio mixtus TaxID=39650 RepID=UPI0005870423|nr:hypothetical protein [Cellvibrio mixtus]